MSEQQPTEATADAPDTAETTASSSGAEGSQGSEGSADTGQELDSGEPGEVGDAQLPEDLRPSEDNPLARHPDQTGDENDQIGADREEDPETAPLSADDADYGSGGG